MEYIINTNFLGEEISYDLIKGKFSVFKNENKANSHIDFQAITEYGDSLKKDSDFMCITIAVTDACNLNCTYCFEKHGKNFLTRASIPSICNLIREYKKSKPHITRVVVIWFGGEPILNFSYILESSSYIKKTCNELELDYSGRIITNGLNIDKIIPHISELSITDIQITLDGTKELHDKRRIRVSGEGSFDKIISNIKKIKSKIDLIIRMNVDRNNIHECSKLYDYILGLSFNDKVRVFFQPMLVENYGGESSCYEGLILDDEEFNEDYLELLEYTNLLDYPKYIGAFCNVNFPGIIVISSDASICKCWAEVTENLNSNISINNKINDILYFMKKEKQQKNRKECINCIVYPVCLGGCLYRNYTSSECNSKRKVILSSIYRLYFREKIKQNIFYKILNNEITWLKSIGCKIKYRDNGIEVSRTDLQTTDFNFFIGNGNNEKCIRLSTMMLNFSNNEKIVVFHEYQKESDYDINYFYFNYNEKIIDKTYVFEEVSLDKWEKNGFIRKSSRYVKYYIIKYGNDIVGKFSVAITDILGIYDFEIFECYRGIGHGTRALRSLISQTDKNIFIQTWNNNYVARKCYENAGFIKYELLYRYIKN